MFFIQLKKMHLLWTFLLPRRPHTDPNIDITYGLTTCIAHRSIISSGHVVAQTQPRITYIYTCVSSYVAMGVRKRIVGDLVCHGCKKPIEGKAHRLTPVGVDACMRLNCAHDYCQKEFITKGKAVPILDVQVHADILVDLIMHSSMGL